MRRFIAIALALAGAAGGYACSGFAGSPQPAAAGASPQQTRVPGEYLVTLAAPADVKAIADLYGRFRITRLQQLAPGVFLVSVSDDPGPAAMEKLGKEDPRIRAVEPNYLYRTQ
jgi:hypothetical protein